MVGTSETTTDLVRQASEVIMLAVNSAVTNAIHRAELCGCRGCKAQAAAAAEWAHELLEAA
jgi:hypothetical protein